MRDSASRLITGDAVDSLDCDRVTVNDVPDPVRADAQPVVPAPVESLSDKRIIHQAGDCRADSAHTVLVSQVAAR
jgi:hypothetical protein